MRVRLTASVTERCRQFRRALPLFHAQRIAWRRVERRAERIPPTLVPSGASTQPPPRLIRLVSLARPLPASPSRSQVPGVFASISPHLGSLYRNNAFIFFSVSSFRRVRFVPFLNWTRIIFTNQQVSSSPTFQTF